MPPNFRPNFVRKEKSVWNYLLGILSVANIEERAHFRIHTHIEQEDEFCILFFALGDPENGTRYIIRSELRDRTYEEPLMLREGETAKKVSIEGMSDALLIMAEDPAYPDGLIMQRKLDEPVQLKQLPLNNRLEESDDRNCQYEYITVWVYNCDDPECLLELFSAE